MAVSTDCKTPGAVYHTHITEEKISIEIDLPKDVLKGISEIQAEGVRDELYNAIEMALAPYFTAWMFTATSARRRRYA